MPAPNFRLSPLPGTGSIAATVIPRSLSWLFLVLAVFQVRADLPAAGPFSRTNLVAWCIVPFDTRGRGPEERAEMLARLGLRRLAYDWRAEHVPTFDSEVRALARHGIELTAWWFPATLNDEAEAILACLRRHRLNPQLWVTLGTEPEPDPDRLRQKIDGAVKSLAPVCAAAARLGSIVGLYNHLGWFGEPANQIAVIEGLRREGHFNVGIVYNFHHGHAHIDQFPRLLRLMNRHLLAVNLNGMVRDGDRIGKKILPLGEGDLELGMLRALRDHGWNGPVGILGHTAEDAEVKLRKELAGLERLVTELNQAPVPPPPREAPDSPRSSPSASASPPTPAPAALTRPASRVTPDDSTPAPTRGAIRETSVTVPALSPVDPAPAPAARTANANPRPARAPDSPPVRGVNREEPWKQVEPDWVDDRWNQTVPGRWQAYYLPTPTGTVRKGLAVSVGEHREATVCYDTATGQWRAAWRGGFLTFDPARFGLLNAPRPEGEMLLALPGSAAWSGGDFAWQGFAVNGHRLVLEYTVGQRRVRESPWTLKSPSGTLLTRDFEFGASTDTALTLVLLTGDDDAVDADLSQGVLRGFRDGSTLTAVAMENLASFDLRRPRPDTIELVVAPNPGTLRARVAYYVGPHPAAAPILDEILLSQGRPAHLAAHVLEAKGPATEPLVVTGQLGPSSQAYAIDTIPVPYDNPWKALMFCSGIGFFDDGDAAVSTIHGDVWRVSGLNDTLDRVEWRRIASGLFQPLGLTVADNRAIVLCRDRLVRLQDVNGDGFTDYYESVSSLIETSPNGHDYVAALCRDRFGNFYYVDPKGAHRLSPDGRQKETIATGFRNPNGMGVHPDGTLITVAPQQGEWTPSSVLHEIRPDGWYGYGGPKVTPRRPLGYDLPLCWIPHRIDNSSGSQVWAPADRFGPLSGQLLHLSWGRCTWLVALRDVVDGIPQGAVVPLPGRFLSGPMRGEFSPRDGRLYVVGCQGWQTAAARDGSLQRVRWTGKPLPLPTAWQAHEGALHITFNEPIDPETAEDPGSYALAAWNYRYSAAYGSKEWSVKSPDTEGRDAWEVRSARVEPDGRTVVLEVPELGPAMQFELRFNLDTASGAAAAGELFGTIHRVRTPQDALGGR